MKQFSAIFSVVGVLWVAIALLATWLYPHYQAYQAQSSIIRDIQNNTAILTREIVLVQQQKTQHYDTVAKILSANDLLVSQLVAGRQAILIDLIASWSAFKRNIEDIKSNFAVYQNSLHYFPKGTADLLLEFVANQQGIDSRNALLRLEQQVVQFSLGHSQQSFAELNAQANVFSATAKQHSPEVAVAIGRLTKHVRILLKQSQRLQQQNSQLLNTEIPRQAQIILDQYRQDFKKKLF